MQIQIRSFVRTSCAAVLLGASPLLANTYIVDSSGSGNFLDIQPAIEFASDGDVLLVNPGSYSNFVLRKPLVIVGQGPGVLVGPVSPFTISKVESVDTGTKAGLAGLVFQGSLTVQDCPVGIVLDAVTLPKGQLYIKNCSDVRVRGSSIVGRDGGNTSNPFLELHHGSPAILADASRVEVSSCSLVGGDGGDCIPCQADGGWGGDGGAGVAVVNAGEVHVARSNLTGGTGGNASPAALFVGAYGGFGGTAMRLGSFPAEASRAQVSGSPEQQLIGGRGGVGLGLGGGGQEGPGKSLRVYNMAAARTSGVLMPNGVDVDSGGTHQVATPDDPTTRIVAAPVAGQVTTFRIHAVPGSNVTLILGRNGQVAPHGSALEEDLLVVPAREIPLGVVDASGVVSFNQFLPLSLGAGFVLHSQARVLMPQGGELRYTNSVPLLLR